MKSQFIQSCIFFLLVPDKTPSFKTKVNIVTSGTAQHFSQLGGLTSDFNWGTEETLLLVSLYFFGNIGEL